ncbi:hypothetical protein Hanom_Chr06g00496411 [Helianthus anomalus]
MAPLSSLHSRLHNIPSSPVVPHLTDGSLKVQRRGILMHTVFGSLFAPAMVPLAFAEEGKDTLKLNMQF